MAPLDFEILSKLMRYVFTFLGALIVWRAFAWLRKDRRAVNRRLRALPDAGAIGLFTVLQGSNHLPEGEVLPVPQEGVLGFVRTCDVVVPVTDVVKQHLDFTFRNGHGLYIYPRRGCPVTVDGMPIVHRADSRRYPMQHGSVLTVGEARLQLGVFAGLDVPQVSGPCDPMPLPPVDTPQPVPPMPCPPQATYAPAYAQMPPQPGTYPPPGAYPPVYQQPLPPVGYPPYSQQPLSPGAAPLTPPERRPDDEA